MQLKAWITAVTDTTPIDVQFEPEETCEEVSQREKILKLITVPLYLQ